MKKVLVILSIIFIAFGTSCTTTPRNAMSSKPMYQTMGKNRTKQHRIQKRKNKQLDSFACPNVARTWQTKKW